MDNISQTKRWSKPQIIAGIFILILTAYFSFVLIEYIYQSNKCKKEGMTSFLEWHYFNGNRRKGINFRDEIKEGGIYYGLPNKEFISGYCVKIPQR